MFDRPSRRKPRRRAEHAEHAEHYSNRRNRLSSHRSLPRGNRRAARRPLPQPRQKARQKNAAPRHDSAGNRGESSGPSIEFHGRFARGAGVSFEFAVGAESSIEFADGAGVFPWSRCYQWKQWKQWKQWNGEGKSSVEEEQNDEKRGAIRDRSEESGVERGPSAIPDDPEHPEQYFAGGIAVDFGDVCAGRDRVPVSADRQSDFVQSGIWVCVVVELLECVEIV